jgi:serine/threonine protein kinase
MGFPFKRQDPAPPPAPPAAGSTPARGRSGTPVNPAGDLDSLGQLTVPEQGPAGDTLWPPAPPGAAGRYHILEEVARGGMGVVYRAQDLNLGRVVALKTIRPDKFDASEDAVRRFFGEARAVAGLCHPHIVPIYEFGTREGRPFFAMAFQAGGSLDDRLGRYAGDPAAAVALVAKVAGAVQFAHARGILHLDLKPANVLLDEAGEPYVSDFGVARAVGSAPECARAHSPAPRRTWPPNRPPAAATGSARPPTSGRWASCCTSC